jgi:4-methyl-5(b-hydroxyethyl)-thiazole monophosphate biosynthesis
MIYIFLANGFEEIEALAVVDILRRCDLDVVIVGIGGKRITGSHNITVECDADENIQAEKIDAVILPGGMPGTLNLENSAFVQKMIDKAAESGALVCAICAAPSVLGHKGLLRGKKATCYPGFETALEGAAVAGRAIEIDGNFITGKGPGVALEFGFAVASRLAGEEAAEKVRVSMQCDR